MVPLEVEVLGDPRRLRVVVQEGKKHEVRAGWGGSGRVARGAAERWMYSWNGRGKGTSRAGKAQARGCFDSTFAAC